MNVFRHSNLRALRKDLAITAASLLSVVICISWIDYPLASVIDRFLTHHGIFLSRTEIPDLLLPGSALFVIIAWVGYWFCKAKNRFSHIAPFARYIGIVIPFVFVVKGLAQFSFGRVYPRVMLVNPDFREFRFFHENLVRGGFPSGHIMVAVPLLIVLCKFSPALRRLWIGLGIALGAALVVTNYHFLGDVMAGAYLGWFVDRVLAASSLKTVLKAGHSR